MSASPFALILLPTLRCNADCEYCFEDKSDAFLPLTGLGALLDKVLTHLTTIGANELLIHWQGGEALTLSPQWYAQAARLIDRAATPRGITVRHGLQTNLLGYGPHWAGVIRDLFGNRVSTSVDYPNLYRHQRGRSPQEYQALWTEKLLQARAAGIDVQAISLPNAATLALGAEGFYRHLVDDLGLRSFQVNTPFPGGRANAARQPPPLPADALIAFYCDLAELWLAEGLDRGVRIGPFDELLARFSGQPATLPCVWTDDCTRHILAIDARGNVAQCDCWVTGDPEHWFGNLFTSDSLTSLLADSQARRRLQRRPLALTLGECIDCAFLAVCHGGCPVRTLASGQDLFDRDPNCTLYQALFGQMTRAAARLAATPRPPMAVAAPGPAGSRRRPEPAPPA